MNFTEFLEEISKEQVEDWWNDLPNETPVEIEKEGWKYSLVKNGKKYPFKWVIDELCKFYNIPFTKKDMSSNLSTRDRFCEKYDFEIEEALVYHSSEAKDVKKLYDKFENTQHIFQDFIDYASKLISENNINAYKIRMAIGKSDTEAMIRIGKRNALCFREIEGEAFIGFIVSNQFIEKNKIELQYSTYPYTNPENGTTLLRIETNNWQEIPKALLESNKKVFASEYNRIKDNKISSWNMEASSTNNALKYVVFERVNIKDWIITNNLKTKPMINQNLYDLKEQFLNEWPLERLKTMRLDEYTNLEKDGSFCYWVEKRTDLLGSVWGGSAYKFGIFERRDLSSTNYNEKRKTDGKYSWYGKYGDNANEVFEEVRDVIIKIAENAKNNKLSEIDDLDLGDAYKWKIAFLYGNYNVMNIFKHEALCYAADYLGYNGDKYAYSYSTLNEFIISKKGDRDFYELSNELWDAYDNDEGEQEFQPINSDVASIESQIKKLVEEFDVFLNKSNTSDSSKRIFIITFNNYLNKYVKINNKIILNNTDYSYFSNIPFESFQEVLGMKNIRGYRDFCHFFRLKIKSYPLNQIFFGPPGTGKTYHTINEAIKIADPVFYELHQNDRIKLKERFKLLQINNKDEGQIAFTTFHQSFSYEDFVEGIKPQVVGENDERKIIYEIEEGVFKKVCRLANDSRKIAKTEDEVIINLSTSEFDKAQFYKMSLGNTLAKEDDEIFDYCIKNNCITIGFGDGYDITGLGEKELRNFGDEHGMERFPIQALNYFKNYLDQNDYVVVSYGNNYIRAIGKVIGAYEYKEESPFAGTTFNHFRKVEWLYAGDNIPVSEVYNKTLSQQSIYKLIKDEIVVDFFVKGNKQVESDLPKNPKNFVLVIDEINRGNVSSIFGELITLIEKDKRAGNDEALSVILPYSKEEFSVPQNVFIVGTMNTADRSIEALDTALRRRFEFDEKPPKSAVIVEVDKLKGKENAGFIDNINLVKVLETINTRIEKLIDKDHKIGHSYFLGLDTKADLIASFQNKVIPLLEEYFFGDFGKIGLILGGSFIEKISSEEDVFASFEEYDDAIVDDLNQRAIYEINASSEWDFESIYA